MADAKLRFFPGKVQEEEGNVAENCAEGGGEGEERGASRYIATNRTPKRTRAEQGTKAEGTRGEGRGSKGQETKGGRQRK